MKHEKSWTHTGKASALILLTMAAVLIFATGALGASKFKVIHTFSGSDGSEPWDTLLLDSAGHLYGTTKDGGLNGAGTVFKLTPNPDGTWTLGTLHSFGVSDGDGPMAGVVMDAVGNLYGTTYSGGTYGGGTAFKLAPNPDGTWTQSVIHDFGGSEDGFYLVGGLTFDTTGNLYGATTLGGIHGFGVVYKLAPNGDETWTESIVYAFTGGQDGAYPDHSSLVFDSSGNIFGASAAGGRNGCNFGANGCGTTFKLTSNPDGTWTQSVIYRFNSVVGSAPESTPLFDKGGNIYGTTELSGRYSYGGVFELVPNADGTWKNKALHQFTGGRDGGNPDAGLIFDAAGNLYGTAAAGGAGHGTVFKFVPNEVGVWKMSVLHYFQGKDGDIPYGGLKLDASGNLYGTTRLGGQHGAGVVFEITP
jgi:uncharacterized repeat protein (TIGR03803 family)